MPFNEDIFRSKRLVLARFSRAIDSGEPDEARPDIDSRGWEDDEHASIVGCTVGSEITVRLERKKIAADAPLFVTSSNTGTMTVVDPPGGALPSGDCEITLSGVRGGDPRKARLEVRFESTTGPIIHELVVHVYEELTVDLTPHFITIDSPTVAGTAPAADLDAIIAQARAIWKPAGINFNVGARRDKTVELATADVVSDDPFPGELATLLSTNWSDGSPNRVDDTINVYFVVQIGARTTLGYGFSRASAREFRMPNPGILLADRHSSSARDGTVHWSNDLAHEIGHFFELWHVDRLEPPNHRMDSWSPRNLMHNNNRTIGATDWPTTDHTGRTRPESPRLNDFGYGVSAANGRPWRGCMITIKELRDRRNDGQTKIARRTINSSRGPY